jgi:TrmH family RNA methyltransferase
LITSLSNDTIKLIRSLQHRKARDDSGLLFVEGLRPFLETLDLTRDLDTVLVAPALLTPETEAVVERCRAYGARVLEVSESILQALSSRDRPEGVAAVVRQRWQTLSSQRPSGASPYWVALQSVREPRNIGAILRVTDAVGAAGVILLDDSADPYSPFSVRASTGAVFSQSIVRASFEELADWLRLHHCPCIGTSDAATTDYTTVAFPTPMVLLMGSERAGLTEAQQSICDAVVRIPMLGHVGSLNVAVATGILLYEAFNQARRRAGRPAAG